MFLIYIRKYEQICTSDCPQSICIESDLVRCLLGNRDGDKLLNPLTAYCSIIMFVLPAYTGLVVKTKQKKHPIFYYPIINTED